MSSSEQRQLAAVLFADIMGYTAMMHADEEHALHALARFEATLKTSIPKGKGTIIQFYGDGCLASFPTAADAVLCAGEMQTTLHPDVPVRMGIHLGDVVFRDGNAFGDSVNIASRIESMGIPGAVLFSSPVHDAVRNKKVSAVSLGAFTFKNVPEPMEVFAMQHAGLPIPKRSEVQGKFQEKPRNKQMSRVIGIVLLVVVAVTLWKLLSLPAKNTNADSEGKVNALAIFPFEYTENDKELTYLSDGIPENLINRLSSLPDLKVFSRNATFGLRDTASDVRHIRSLLNADAVLTGQLTKVNDYLIINCQLIDTRNSQQIWGEKITQKAQNLIELEDTLVTALLNPLRLHLQGGKGEVLHRKGTTNPEAYEHYMQGRYLTYGSTLEESERAIDHFRQAIKLDPRYAEAYAAIGNEKIIQAIFSTDFRPDMLDEARMAAQSAIVLDSTVTEAYLVKAAIKFYGDYDWKGADTAYRQALKMNPDDPTAMIRYSAYLAAMGRDDEAVPLALKAVRTDPVSTSSLHNLGWVSFLAKDYVQAKQAFGKALELHPNWIWGYVKKAYSHIRLNECDTASVLAKKGFEILGDTDDEVLKATFIYINRQCGNLDVAKQQESEFFAHLAEHSYEDPLAVMFVYHAIGETEKAIDWAEKMVEERSPSVYLLIIKSFWDPEFYQQPRYQALLRKLGV